MNTDNEQRRQWMGVLAKSSPVELEKAWADLEKRPVYTFLRPPETGLVMVRALAGGVGSPFHLGEVPVTRCTVETEQGMTGSAYVMGRAHRHAELAALFDAILQDAKVGPGILEEVIEPLERERRARAEAERRETDRTRVEFFTMVRGE